MSCKIFGVINVTPDSFSDGGSWLDANLAIEHGKQLIAEGADVLDIGGESTRPGAARVDEAEELRRVIPVIKGLAELGATISIDTTRAEVAKRAIAAGASIINDVSGGRADDQMIPLVASLDVPFVIMHWRGHSERMQTMTDYDDVVGDVIRELTDQVEHALASGVDSKNIIIDPGLGLFSKTADQNWTLLKNLDQFLDLGYRVLVGASRKRFLGELLASGDELRTTEDREDATTAISALAAAAGVWAVRVHNVRSTADAIKVVNRWKQG